MMFEKQLVIQVILIPICIMGITASICYQTKQFLEDKIDHDAIANGTIKGVTALERPASDVNGLFMGSVPFFCCFECM